MRRLRLEESQFEKILAETLKSLLKGKKTVTVSQDTMLKLPRAKPDERIKLLFSELAWNKMEALVDHCGKEVCWHGTVKPMSGGYYIQDILVYPQLATQATVEADEEHYHAWLNALPDDEFNTIRLQGHSHVNMASSPSGVDTDFYETLIQHVKDYYIFFILNKRSEFWCNVYDIKNNVVYEKEDIDIDSEYEGFDYDAWSTDMIKQYVNNKQVTYPKPGVATPLSPTEMTARQQQLAYNAYNPMDDYDPSLYGRRSGY